MTEWRVIADFPEYELSECGRVRRLVRGGQRYPAGYELVAKKHARGYLVYTLRHNGRDKSFLAHRLVALHFIGPPPTEEHEVAHNDGSRTNNHWRNLRWATPRENQADRKRHGTHMTGEQCTWTTKLSNQSVLEIRDSYGRFGKRYSRNGLNMQTLADQYGVSLAQISRVVNAKQWAS